MKKITIVWIILIVILITALSFIGINISNHTKPYKALEGDIVDAMKVYYGQDTNLTKLPSNGKTHKVTIEDLITFGLTINNKINNDECSGYGIVTGKMGSHTYKAYIKCNEYATENYKNQ
ncbi:MAG: hypothetical protein E7161_05040 [Firmicutes bacterium]|nr:hypothetical protein [Bacillota bacterium]